MKPVFVPSTLRTLVTSLVIVSLTGQQIAFASGLSATNPPTASAAITPPLADVHSALPLAKTGKQGVMVVELAESRPFSSYFEKGGSPAEIDRLNADLKNLAVANSLVGIADDLEGFQKWWPAHQTSILLSHSKLQNENLEGFFTQVFIVYKADKTQGQKDPNQFIEWLNSKVTNPVVRGVSFTAFAILIGTLSYTVGLVKGAMVAGPAASMIGALVEPVVRPIREKASIVGSRLFGKWGVALSDKLFKGADGKADGANQDLNQMASEVEAARANAKEAKVILNSMGYDMTPAQYASAMSKLHTIWNKTNQVWVQTNPALFKDGRDVFSNAIAMRPQAYTAQLMTSLQGAEQARQAIEANIDRIVVDTHKTRSEVEGPVISLLRAVEINENASQANKEAAQEGFTHARESLKALGATEYQVNRIIESRLNELVYVRHTAYTLATSVIHELQYEEYNRALSDDVQSIQRALRDGTCLDYFHNQFKEQVSKILNEMDIRLSVAETTLEAAKASPDLKIVKPKKGSGQGSSDAADQAAKPRPKSLADKVSAKVNRATSALSRMNSTSANRAAIERTGDLRGEKADAPADAAAEAVSKAGKK